MSQLRATSRLNSLQTLIIRGAATYQRLRATFAGMWPFSIRSTLILVLIVGGTSSIYVFGVSLITVLIALGLAGLLYVPFAKRYGWGNEGRLTRHLSRPPFEDESRKAS